MTQIGSKFRITSKTRKVSDGLTTCNGHFSHSLWLESFNIPICPTAVTDIMFPSSQVSHAFDYGTQENTADVESMASLFGNRTHIKTTYSNSHDACTGKPSTSDTEALLRHTIQSFIQSRASSISRRQLSALRYSKHWNLKSASKLMDFISSMTTSDVLDTDIIDLLAHIIPQWSAPIVYATMIHNTNSDHMSMQMMLVDSFLQRHENDERSRACLRVLVHVVSSVCTIPMDRSLLLEGFLDSDIQQVAKVVMKIYKDLLNAAETNTVIKDANYRIDESACLLLLSSLSVYNITDWLVDLDEKVLSILVQTLLQNAQQLTTSDPEDVIMNLTSLQLLSLIQANLPDDIDIFPDFTNMIHSTNIVDTVMRLATSSAAASNQALKTLQIWSICQDEAWSSFLTFERELGTISMESWQGLLNVRLELLPMILTFRSIAPFTSKRALDHVLSTDRDGHTKLLQLLFEWIHHEDEAVANGVSALLRQLLNDRRYALHHDALSRQFWEIMNKFPVESLVNIVIKVSLRGPSSHFTLVCMIDVLEMILQYSSDANIATKQVETLIELLSSHTADANSDESTREVNTPQASNLSKLLDESHISLDDVEKEAKDQPRGMDYTVQLATCMVLARMSKLTDTVMQSRILNTVKDYMLHIKLLGMGVSRDRTRRLFRLQVLMATLSEEFEDIISSAHYDAQQCHRQELYSGYEEIAGYKKQVRDSQDRIEDLSNEKALLQRAIKSNTMLFERDVKKAIRKAESRASQLAEVHLGERKGAEHQLAEAVACLSTAQNRLCDAEQQLETEKEKHIQQVEEIDHAKSRIEEMKVQHTEQQMKTEQFKLDTHRLMTEVDASRDYAEDMQACFKSVSRRLEATQDSLQQVKGAYNELQEEVESIYGSLVSLATIYQAKELNVVDMQQIFDRKAKDALRKVELERSRTEELETETDRLRRENEKLLKKLTTVKETLEDERNDHAEEAARRKRNGPVSYIYQLHNSSTSERYEHLPKRKTNFDGKENTSHLTSTRRNGTRASSESRSSTDRSRIRHHESERKLESSLRAYK